MDEDFVRALQAQTERMARQLRKEKRQSRREVRNVLLIFAVFGCIFFYLWWTR